MGQIAHFPPSPQPYDGYGFPLLFFHMIGMTGTNRPSLWYTMLWH